MDPDARSKRQQPRRPSQRRPSRWIDDSDHHEPPSPTQPHSTPLRPNFGQSSVVTPSATDRLTESRPIHGPSVLIPPNLTPSWPGVFVPPSSSSLGRSYKRVDSHPTDPSVPGGPYPPPLYPASRDDPVVVKLEPTSGIENSLDAPTSTIVRPPPTGLVGWSDHPPLPPLTTTSVSYPNPQLYDPRDPFEPHSHSRPPPSRTSGMPTGSASSSRLAVNNPGRGRRRSGQSNAIIDIDPIILRERERMEIERMQRENAAPATSTTTSTTITTGPPAHYSHQTLTAAGPSRRPISPRGPLGLLDSSSFVPPPLQPFPFPRDPTLRSSPPLDGDTRRRTSSLTTNPLIPLPLQQHHRLPTTSAAPIASAISNSTTSGGPLVGPSSSHNNYPPGSQPSVMALPPGSAARIADGPSGSGSGGLPPPGTVLITSGGPSVAGHHPHQVQGGMHPAHDNGAHDKMNMLLGEIRSEYEVLQTDCMVLKGQRDEYENKSKRIGS